jgi:hypothetical protein
MTNTSALRLDRPFLPADVKKPDIGRAFTRAAFAVGRNALSGPGEMRGAEGWAERLWVHDRAAVALTRAANSPASTGGWGGVLSGTSTADFLSSLVPESAAAKLIAAGLRIDMTGYNSILIPHRSGNLPATDVAWISELNAFPVRQTTLATTTLGPVHKMASSVSLSREMAESAGGQEVFDTLLREDIGASLDASIFSATAASPSRPAGILNGISGLTPTASGGEAALRGDIAKLAAVVGATGSNNIAFITSPAYALRLATYPNVTGPNLTVWPSVAVSDATIIAVAVDAFVSGFGSVPRILTSKDALVHMEDSSPAATISSAGTPNTIVAPVRSAFQTDSIVVRAILDAAWTLRSSAAVTWMSSVTW